MSKYIRLFKWFSVILAASTMVLSVLFLPYFLESLAWRFPEYEFLIDPAMYFIWATSIGFYYIVLLLINICSNAQSGKGFTISTAKLFDRIAVVALVEIVAYMIGFVIASIWIMKANPYLVFLFFIVAFFCFMIFGVCKVMKHLLRRVADIKEDNEYTI